jgi:hypothetical protein
MTKDDDFSEDTKIKVLLWSDRHCCVCGKRCGLDIEVHHIDSKGGEDIDNAIPVCYTCHAHLGRYIDSQPRGTKYKVKETKKRRDQIYERYTRHLVPGILPSVYQRYLGQKVFELPRVGFIIKPVGRFIPVKAIVIMKVFLGGQFLEKINSAKPYYNGEIIWNLNPGIGVNGNFTIPQKCADSKEELQLELTTTIIDPYERKHELLPVCFTYVRPDAKKGESGDKWYLEPTEFSQLKPYLKTT